MRANDHSVLGQCLRARREIPGPRRQRSCFTPVENGSKQSEKKERYSGGRQLTWEVDAVACSHRRSHRTDCPSGARPAQHDLRAGRLAIALQGSGSISLGSTTPHPLPLRLHAFSPQIPNLQAAAVGLLGRAAPVVAKAPMLNTYRRRRAAASNRRHEQEMWSRWRMWSRWSMPTTLWFGGRRDVRPN
jgi:hypothetical protein